MYLWTPEMMVRRQSELDNPFARTSYAGIDASGQEQSLGDTGGPSNRVGGFRFGEIIGRQQPYRYRQAPSAVPRSADKPYASALSECISNLGTIDILRMQLHSSQRLVGLKRVSRIVPIAVPHCNAVLIAYIR